MGDLAHPAVRGLMASGTISSAVGAHRQGEAARKAAEFNETLIRRETSERITQALSESRRRRASNVVRVAKSGVRLEGSPLAVIEDNEYQDARERMMIRESGAAAADLMRARGRMARASARFSVASEVVSGAGRIGALAIRNA